jgi:hypothetical protein
MLGHLVSNTFHGGADRTPRSGVGLFRRIWAYFFGR